MTKGIDFTGITVSFYCHDGEGNFVLHKRSENCRDEHGNWDCGGGGLKFNERLLDAVKREVNEEYGTDPVKIEYLGVDEVFREHDGKPTHWLSFRYKVLVDRDKVINNEPHKHSELIWTTIDNLPSPMHSQVGPAIEKYKDQLK